MASYLRIGSVFCAAALSICLLAASARADSAEAALTEASKMMEKGIPVKAIEYIDAALGSGKLSPAASAKALLMRAQAQEKLNKLAFALADYNSALWMEGLSAADKTQAEQGRDRISGKLGIAAEPSGKEGAPGGRTNTGEDTVARAPTSASKDANVKSSPSEQRTGGIGSVFSGIFGSSEPAQEPQPAKPPVAEAPKPVKPVVAAKPAGTVKPERAQAKQATAEKPAQVAVVTRALPVAGITQKTGRLPRLSALRRNTAPNWAVARPQ